MIVIVLQVKESIVCSLQAQGHASSHRGYSVLCANVSLLLRSTLQVFSQQSPLHLQIEAKAENAGLLEWHIVSYHKHLHQWLSGVSALLLTALAELEQQHPKQLQLRHG